MNPSETIPPPATWAMLDEIARVARRLIETLPPLDPDSPANAWVYTLGQLLAKAGR